MKKHFVTVKISFLTFLRHCIKQYPSIRFCAVSMADQQSVLSLAKTDCRKNSQKILLSKEKESSCSRTSGAIRSWYQMQSWLDEQDELYQVAKSKGISGQKKRIPPNSARQRPTLYNQAQKRYDCGGLLQQKDSWWSLSDGGQEIRYHKNTYEHLTNFSNLSYKRDKKQK